MRVLLVVALAGLFGCSGGSSGGGSNRVPIITFEGNAKPISGSCVIAGVPVSDFAYAGTFSRSIDGGRTYFTDGVSTYDAGFDGQFASFGVSEVGAYGLVDGGSCSPCEMTFSQTGRFALLSPSQDAKAGGACPTNALTGGVTSDEDAGVFGPLLKEDGGTDAVRVCGEYAIKVTGEGINCDPGCLSCTALYRVTGAPK